MGPVLIVIGLILITFALVLYFSTRKRERQIIICFDEMDEYVYTQVLELLQKIPVLGAKYSHDKWNRTIYMVLIVEKRDSELLYEKLKKIPNLEVTYK